MPSSTTLQSNFTKGQLKEEMYARVGFQDYYHGSRVFNNCLTLPTGGAAKRFGTKFVADLTPVGGSDPANYNLAVLEYDENTAYVCVFHSGKLRIYEGETGAFIQSLSSPYTTTQTSEIDFAQNSSEIVTVHNAFKPYILRRTSPTTFTYTEAVFRNLPTSNITTNYDNITFSVGAKTGNNKDLKASSSIFTAQMVGGLYTDGVGTMRIKTYVTPTLMRGNIIEDFDDIQNLSGDLSVLKEPAFSDAKGWPQSITFSQNRLIFGPTTDLANGVFFSKTNDYFNFDDSEAFEDSSFNTLVTGDGLTHVNYLLGSQNVLMFTPSGVFTTSNTLGEPLTPEAQVNLQSLRRLKSLKPVIADNQIFVVSKSGKTVTSLSFDFTAQRYTGVNMSVVTNVITNPIDTAVFDNPPDYDGTFIIYVNEDGTLAILTSLVEQNVIGWSSHDTDGEFLAVASSGTDVWFLVKRIIDGETKIYLEQLDFNFYTDCSFEFASSSATNVITGLEALEGKSVWVKSTPGSDGTGFFLGAYVVTGGTITVAEENAATTFHIGLPYNPSIVPMPINIDTQRGPTLYEPKRVSFIYVDYLNTLGLRIDDDPIPQTSFSNFIFGEPVALASGFVRYPLQKGWDPFETITISQSAPFPFLVRSLVMKVDFDMP